MKNKSFESAEAFTVIQVRETSSRKMMDCWIDTADLATVAAIHGTWYAYPARAPVGKFYVSAKQWVTESQQSVTVMIHRVILGISDPLVEVDHRDNDGLNNRRSNLRPCTHKENLRFSQPDKDWVARDARQIIAEEYRQERAIAREVETLFGLTRQGLYKIRMDRSHRSAAAKTYRAAISAAGVRDLLSLHAENGCGSGKFGIKPKAEPCS